MSAQRMPAGLIWSLGVTQVIGYGTLYYSFAILAPGMAKDFSLPLDQVFGLLSLALLAGGAIAPKAGGWADRFGAGRIMAAGSLAAGSALTAAAFSPNAVLFGVALVTMQIAATFVLYGIAFAAIVEIGGRSAPRSITHLTLVAGFASTFFWPLTGTLSEHYDWRTIYLVFAALNLFVCLPLHCRLAQYPRLSAALLPPDDDRSTCGPAPPQKGLFALLLAAFAIEGMVLASILTHMVPLVTALGLGKAGLWISTLFGPAQVASRLINMLFGGRLPQAMLAVLATSLVALALAFLLATSPWLPGMILFAVLFGLGSGLTSIVGGTLPLELFGTRGYGARLGWVTAARQFSSALAPFAFALMMQGWGTGATIAVAIGAGMVGTGLFGAIVTTRSKWIAPARDVLPWT